MWVVSALCVLHNILVHIREVDEEDTGEADSSEDREEEDGEELSVNQHIGAGYHITRRETARATARRDAIAAAMWESYLERQ